MITMMVECVRVSTAPKQKKKTHETLKIKEPCKLLTDFGSKLRTPKTPK